eukprot:jgi/Mesen1/4058/ME000213S03081
MAEETILVGEDLMSGPPSPVIPPELADKVLDGLHTNEVEPFCQDELLLFRRCVQQRDQLLRARLLVAEGELASGLPRRQVAERKEVLERAAEGLERKMMLAAAFDGMIGFQTRWRLHGELQDTKSRLEVLEKVLANSAKLAGSEKRPWWRPL